MRLMLLLAVMVALTACQGEQKVSNRKTGVSPVENQGNPEQESADQNPHYAKLSDLGCEEPTVSEWSFYDSAGGKQPICTLLSESSAKAVVLLPVDYLCGTCLDQLAALKVQLKKLSGVTIAMVARAGTTHPEVLALLAATNDAKTLLYVDKDAHFAQRLAARGFDWNDPVSYTFSANSGLYMRFDTPSFLERIKTFFKLLSSESERQFSWDGMANQGHGEWVIE